MINLGKFKEQVDEADLANGDSTAAYLVASGTLLTSELIGTAQSLHVKSPSEKASNTAFVAADYLSISGAVRHDDDATGIATADGQNAPLLVDEFGRLKVSATIDVTSNDVYAEDSVAANGALGALALVVRKDALTTNVSADGDYATLLQWSEGSLKVVDQPNIAAVNTAVSVAQTAIALPTTALAFRRNIMVQNLGNQTIFIGGATVTTATGIAVPKNAAMEVEAGPSVPLFAISATGTQDVRVLELS